MDHFPKEGKIFETDHHPVFLMFSLVALISETKIINQGAPPNPPESNLTWERMLHQIQIEPARKKAHGGSRSLCCFLPSGFGGFKKLQGFLHMQYICA